MRLTATLALCFCTGLACTAVAQPSAQATATLRGQTFTIEVATTPAEQTHGLMDRTSMPPNHGMLFVFADTEPRTFWMKNTLIPLDMVFFNGERRVVAIQADAKPCRADPCRLYPSTVPARYVLELNAGTAHRLGLHKGDVMTLSGVAARTQ
ncbi:MAG TPA: DUF192 domain-containing protein [Rhodanobacteraceae bacterium]|nr:DUF192 domain-containing protein [Rhodanobacteraceae bacterium]